MKKTLFCAVLAALPALAQTSQAQTQAPAIDNARVTVRDIVLEPGKPGPVIAHAGDYAILYLQGGRIRGSDGRAAMHPDGGAAFGHGGVTSDTAVTAPAHEIVEPRAVDRMFERDDRPGDEAHQREPADRNPARRHQRRGRARVGSRAGAAPRPPRPRPRRARRRRCRRRC